jgi:uncharacterized protein YjbI with pentapeptide repeats
MTNSSVLSLWLTRFNIRELVLLIAIVMLGYGWISSEQRADRDRRLRANQLRHAELELVRARDDLRNQSRGPQPDRNRSFWEADLEGTNLTGMMIASKSNAFQRACFRKCVLVDAVLEGGGSSFQRAQFDGGNLVRARLKGGTGSFQKASFAAADLTDATLAGESGSFQGASFEDAVLVHATLSGNFQSVNFSGARLESAELSAIEAGNLASCYFKIPPTYDAKTKFPAGFDPVEHLWTIVK